MMQYSIVELCLILLYAGHNIKLTNAQTGTSFGDCQTPTNEAGSCIYLSQCPPINSILQKGNRITNEERTFLQSSQCGYHNDNYLVCCRKLPQNLLPQLPNCPYEFKPRVVGGHETEFDEFPWLAMIEYTKPDNTKGFHCGGSLINNRYVLTAAHCLKGSVIIVRRYRPTSVRLGEWDTRSNPDCVSDMLGQRDCADPHVDITIESFIAHPAYLPSGKNQYHDIGLIRLAQAVRSSAFIKPICLPLQTDLRNAVHDRRLMDVAGWGKTETTDNSPVAMTANLTVWNQNDCRRTYTSLNLELNEGQMCAGGQQGVDSCNGDSGGPLFYKHTTNRPYFILAGIVSFGGTECGQRDLPGVYTRVSNYIDWIRANVKH